MSSHNQCLRAEIKTMNTPVTPDYIKVGVKGVTLAWAYYPDGGGGGSRPVPTKPDCVSQMG